MSIGKMLKSGEYFLLRNTFKIYIPMFTKLAQRLSQIEDVRLGFLNIPNFHICIKGEKNKLSVCTWIQIHTIFYRWERLY